MADSCGDNATVSVASSDKQEEKSAESDKEPVVQTVTIEDVRAVLAEKSQSGLTSKVKELLESFGACKLSAVNEADYTSHIIIRPLWVLQLVLIRCKLPVNRHSRIREKKMRLDN